MTVPPPRKPAAQSLEQSVEVETPEQVVFAYTIAGVGSRSAAALIDYGICLVAVFGIIFLYSIVSASIAFGLDFSGSADLMMAFVVIFFFLLIWGYYVLFEALADGQTPGKRAMGLRVVQDGGYSVSFAASAVRNIVRIVDFLPGFYAVGMLAVILSKTGKRLGDHAAGTLVVQERAIQAPVAPAAEAAATVAPLSTQLGDDEYALLERYLVRRSSLNEQTRIAFDRQIAERLASRLPTGDPAADLATRLSQVYEQEKALRARGVASRSDTGAAREQHAIVASGATRWSGFSKALIRARTVGIKKLSEDEVAELAAQYREVSTDLARLRTASRGRQSDASFYLSRLVALGHNILYRRRELLPLIVWNYLFVTVPREVRRSAAYILLAALLFFGPMIVAYAAVSRNPVDAHKIVGANYVEYAARAHERERNGMGYVGREAADNAGAFSASRYVTNNVQVAFNAFALGITAGIGTTLILLTNGVGIGTSLGIFKWNGALHQILAFVTPHGVLELTAICLAGGAGFLIGSAFLLPGTLTRREALIVRGRRAIRLVAAAGLFLLVAGIIEGIVSPRNLQLRDAAVIGATSGVFIIIYFFAGVRSKGAPEEEFGYSEERAFRSR